MTEYLISLSLLICAVLLIRGIFRRTISPRAVYALWLVVVIRMCLPIALFEVDVELPDFLQHDRTEQSEIQENQPESSEPSADTTVQTAPANPVQNPASAYPSPTTPTYPVQTPTTSVPSAPSVTTPVTPITPSTPETEAPTPIEPVAPEELTLEIPEETVQPNWGRIAGIVWVVGSAAVAAWVVITSASFNYRLYKDRKLHRSIRGTKVYVSASTGVPCIAGFVPSIYITPEAANSKSEMLIIIHEHIHLRHGDHIWSIVRALAMIVFWWNPLVWIAATVSKQDAELACDDAIAAKLNDETRLKYAHILLDTIPQKHRYAVGFGSAPMKERILMLTKKQKNRWICLVLAVVLALSAVGCSFISLNEKAAEDEKKDPNGENTESSLDPLIGYDGEYEFLMTDESERVSLYYGAEENDFALYFRISFGEYEAYIAPSTGAWLRYTWKPMITCMDIGIPEMPADGTEDAVVILTTGTGTGIHMKEAYVLSGADGTLNTFTEPYEVIENAVSRDENGKTWIVDSSGKRVDLPDNAYFDQNYKYYIENGKLFAEVSIGYGMLQYNGDCFKVEYSADGVTWKYHSQRMYDIKPSLTIPCDELLSTMEQIETDEAYPDEIYTIDVTGLSVPVKLYMRMDSVAAVEAHGHYVELRESRDIYGNCNSELFEADGAIILEGGYYRIGDVYILAPEKYSEIHPGDDASYFLSIEDGRLRYRHTHNSIADITQTGALSVAVSYDEFLYSAGDASIVNGEVVFAEPDESYVMSDKYNLDEEFERIWSDSYGSIEEKFAANRAAREEFAAERARREAFAAEAAAIEELRQVWNNNDLYVGYIESESSETIDICSKNGTLMAKIPREILTDFPAINGTETGILRIPFYYGEYYNEDYSTFRWVIVCSPIAMGSGTFNVCTSTDNGATWWVGEASRFEGSVTSARFVSENVGFISHAYWSDNGPNISRTTDGGKTWERMEIAIPDELSGYRMTPYTPRRDDDALLYPVVLYDDRGAVDEVHLMSYDGGLTWEWEQTQTEETDKFSTYSIVPRNSNGSIVSLTLPAVWQWDGTNFNELNVRIGVYSDTKRVTLYGALPTLQEFEDTLRNSTGRVYQMNSPITGKTDAGYSYTGYYGDEEMPKGEMSRRYLFYISTDNGAYELEVWQRLDFDGDNFFEDTVQPIVNSFAIQQTLPHHAIMENQSVLYDTSAKKEMLLNDWLKNIEMSVSKYTVIDLDRDTNLETVLWLTRGTNEYVGFLILHSEQDMVYAYEMPYRAFKELKADATFSFSSGVSNHGIGRIDFSGDTDTVNKIAYCESGVDQQVTYFIESRNATKEEFDAYVTAQSQKQTAVWREYGKE